MIRLYACPRSVLLTDISGSEPPVWLVTTVKTLSIVPVAWIVLLSQNSVGATERALGGESTEMVRGRSTVVLEAS